jgi:hypothetical protein
MTLIRSQDCVGLDTGHFTPPANGAITVAFVASENVTVIDLVKPREVFETAHLWDDRSLEATRPSVAAGIERGMSAIELAQQGQFDIAPQQLPSALLKFSTQSNIQVTVAGVLAEGKQSTGVVGRFNAGDALAILLQGTSLHYEMVDASTVVITGSERRAARNDFQEVNSPAASRCASRSWSANLTRRFWQLRREIHFPTN